MIVCTTKMSAAGKPARDRTRILTDSARKGNRKLKVGLDWFDGL